MWYRIELKQHNSAWYFIKAMYFQIASLSLGEPYQLFRISLI